MREARQIFKAPGIFGKNFNLPLDALGCRWLYGGSPGGFMGGIDDSDGSVLDNFHWGPLNGFNPFYNPLKLQYQDRTSIFWSPPLILSSASRLPLRLVMKWMGQDERNLQ